MRIYKVLLVEDDPESAEIITRYLQKYNFDVTHAWDGLQGMVKVKNVRFDLLICDIMMPGVDGWRFLERSQDSLGNTPIIMTTALNDRQSVVKGKSFEVAAYLVKPIDQAALLDRVVQALKIKQSDLVSKKDYPFTFNVSVVLPVLNVTLGGIPTSESLERLQDLIKSVAEPITECEIAIAKEFTYFAANIELLEQTVRFLDKKFNIKATNVTLGGSFLNTVGEVEAISENRLLKQCKQK